MEPEQLKRGKEFHKKVQDDWKKEAQGNINVEHTIDLVKQDRKRKKKGRIDLFVDDMDDQVAVVEIKSTNWDKIKPANIQKNLGSHRRQIWKYISKYYDGDKLSVSPGIIYPHEPISGELKIRIETYLNDWGIQVVWYFD